MKVVMTVIVAVLIAGSVACSSLSSLPFMGVKNQLESIVAVTVAGTYTVKVIKDGQMFVEETWECTQAEGKLTGCHKK
jgi:Na+-translocating ferredoxin:NAD+ oxidoreductase RnfA subunit